MQWYRDFYSLTGGVHCRLQEADMGEQAVTAIVKLSRDPHIPTKLAAAQATGSLLRAELDGHLPDGCAMEPLVPVLVALLGRDQNSEVQRQGLQVSLGVAYPCYLLHHAPSTLLCMPYQSALELFVLGQLTPVRERHGQASFIWLLCIGCRHHACVDSDRVLTAGNTANLCVQGISSRTTLASSAAIPMQSCPRHSWTYQAGHRQDACPDIAIG